MKRLNLCIDIDGTLTQAYDWIPRVNEYFNTHIWFQIEKMIDNCIQEFDEFKVAL